MSTLEKRIEEMQKKASAKSAELQTMATAPDISDKKKERLENRAEKVEERADKREGVMRSNAEWWEWIKGGMNSAPATTPQSDTTNQPQTATPQTATTTTTTTTTPPQVTTNQPQTKAEGGTTPQTTTEETETTTTTTESKPKTYAEVLEKVTKDQNEKNLASLKALQEINTKGLSAYQTLLKDSIKRREELAQKKERNARSQAIANALGSLVNVITAGAIAKRNGSIPIVADYDATADTALRKSIEDRYTLGNENEALLLSLANERRKHEAEIAKQNYAQEVAANTELAKAKLKPYETAEALRLYNAKQAAWAEARKDIDNNKAKKTKSFKYDKAKIDQFVAEATTWDYEEDDPVIKGRKVKKTHTSKPSSAESNVAEQVAKYCQENKVSDNVTSVLSEVYRKLFQTIKPEVTKKFGNDLTKSIISAIKAGRNADEAYNVAKTYIEENK